MKRNWYKGSHKENRNIRFGKDIIWNQMVQNYRQRIADLKTKEGIEEYEDICQERIEQFDDYDYDYDYLFDDPFDFGLSYEEDCEIVPPPHTQVSHDPNKYWGIEDRDFRLIEKLGERLNDPASMTFDERRDWANWINQCFVRNASSVDPS